MSLFGDSSRPVPGDLLDLSQIPEAEHFSLCKCGDCGLPMMVLYDDKNRPVISTHFPPDVASEFAKALQLLSKEAMN